MSRLDRLDKEFSRLEKVEALLDRISNCQNNNEDLNNWEDDFLESIENWLRSEGHGLSDNQLNKLEQIELVVAEGRQAAWD